MTYSPIRVYMCVSRVSLEVNWGQLYRVGASTDLILLTFFFLLHHAMVVIPKTMIASNYNYTHFLDTDIVISLFNFFLNYLINLLKTNEFD